MAALVVGGITALLAIWRRRGGARRVDAEIQAEEGEGRADEEAQQGRGSGGLELVPVGNRGIRNFLQKSCGGPSCNSDLFLKKFLIFLVTRFELISISLNMNLFHFYPRLDQ